ACLQARTTVVLASLSELGPRGTMSPRATMTVRVLIVDDQEPFRLAGRLVVDAADGFDVVGEAETGEASVEMARELAPDLVLMDVNLPGINGLEDTRRILSAAG